MLQDLRHALRSLAAQPAFTAVAVLTLAFGIGVNTTLFGMVSVFFLEPLDVEEPEELVIVMQRGDVIGLPYGHSFVDYRDIRDGLTTLEDLAAYFPSAVHLGTAGQPAERTWVEIVTPGYFELARVQPALGRFFDEREDASAPELVLAHAYWERRFGGDAGVVGSTVTLNGSAYTVVGVLPEGFKSLSWAMAVSGFVPTGSMPSLMENGQAMLEGRGAHAFRIMGRLADGRTLVDARSEVELVTNHLYERHPAEHKGSRALVFPESMARPDPAFADFVPVFAAIFSAMVALVLFIACANVANLMLSRAVEQQRDLVVRSALGAGRWRLVRLQLAETLVMAAIAGLLGYGLSMVAGAGLSTFAPAGDLPVDQSHEPGWTIYAFTFLVATVAGLASGLWPALAASRFDPGVALREGGTRIGSGRHPIRNLLVVGQVTLSVVVLVCGGLFLHSLQRMQELALGFRPDHLALMSLDLGLQQYEDDRGRQFLERLEEEAEALPGVENASFATHVPFDYGLSLADVATGEDLAGSDDGYLSAAWSAVGHDYFETAEVPLLRGRRFDRRDREDAPAVAVVNQRLAEQLWPGRDPMGQRFRMGRDGEWVEVVGLAPDGRYVMLGEEPRAYFFRPIEQAYRSPATLVVRTGVSPESLTRPLEELLQRLDPDLPPYNVGTMDRHIATSAFGLMPLRAGAAIAGVQGVIGLALAMMGLYAVVAYGVSRRTREIGVRVALGAPRHRVLLLVAREGLAYTGIGLAIGVVLAGGIGFALSHVLFGVDPVDPTVLVLVTLLLLGVAAAACWLPARRATRIDPMAALRCD